MRSLPSHPEGHPTPGRAAPCHSTATQSFPAAFPSLCNSCITLSLRKSLGEHADEAINTVYNLLAPTKVQASVISAGWRLKPPSRLCNIAAHVDGGAAAQGMPRGCRDHCHGVSDPQRVKTFTVQTVALCVSDPILLFHALTASLPSQGTRRNTDNSSNVHRAHLESRGVPKTAAERIGESGDTVF